MLCQNELLENNIPFEKCNNFVHSNLKMEYKIYLKQFPVEICCTNANQACQTGAPLTVCNPSESSSSPTSSYDASNIKHYKMAIDLAFLVYITEMS
jgi:hypothetical protein